MTTRGRFNPNAIEEEIMETTREGYQEKMEAQLKQWSTRLEVLQAKAEKAGADTKKELLAALAEFKQLEVAARQHLATVETAAATTWGDVKTDLTDKWNHVSGAVDAIWARVS
jgi:hypothetical protein